MTPTLTFNPSQYYSLYRPSRCELRLYLSGKEIKPSTPGAYAQLLFRLGQMHEKRHLVLFPDHADLTGEPVERTEEELRKGTKVIYQGLLQAPAIIDGRRVEVAGIPDFLIKSPGGYVVRDCKLVLSADEVDHPEITRQLQTYGWLYEQMTGTGPVRLEVLTGDGGLDVLDYAGRDAALAHMGDLLDIISLPEKPYGPAGWTKCGGCGYGEYCVNRAGKNRDIALLYGLDQNLAVRLRGMGVSTLDDLVARFDEQSLSEVKRPWGEGVQKVGRKAASILLQARAMLDNKEIVIGKPVLPVSRNYVMFDLEGLPPQLDELDKIYLWGMKVHGERPGPFRFSLAEPGVRGDKAGWERFLTLAREIFLEYGEIPFVHWHQYERTKINAYIDRYGDRDGIAKHVLSRLVDLLPITRAAVVLPETSYSFKVMEKYIGFKRTQDEYGGEWSIAKYIEAVETEDEEERKALINEIVKYNEEDLQAKWAVFEWLRTLSV